MSITTQPRNKPFLKKLASVPLKAGSEVFKACAAMMANISLGLEWVRLRYIDFIPRPDDIFIVTYPRSGTTWMQMILYQLTSNGEMNFVHISEVVPWFEQSSIDKRDLNALPSPRIFKSHLPYNGKLFSIPKGCKYIYLVRNGKDVAVSYYHFYTSHLGFKGTFPEFFERFIRGKVQYGSWFKHVAGWMAHKDDPNVLVIRYEDLINDLAGSVQKIADFCGFEVSPEKMAVVLERSSFAYMKKYEIKFDPAVEVIWQLHGTKVGSFLRRGGTGYAKEYLTSEQEARFEQEFRKWLGDGSLIGQ